MSDPYVGEVRLVGFTFAPLNWAFCQGQSMPISEYDALFSLIGTTYGGDGQMSFNLPDLRGRIPLHNGRGVSSVYQLGQAGGAENVTLVVANLPAHTHSFMASTNNANSNTAAAQTLGSGVSIYANKAPSKNLNPAMIGPAGGNSQPHANLQPYQVLNWIIALNGIYPNRG